MSEIVKRLRETYLVKSYNALRGCQDCGIAANDAAEAAARIEELEAALRNVMVGGNHLVSIMGIPHPAVGMTHEYVLSHYGAGCQYDAWCCWNAIMQARAALEDRG